MIRFIRALRIALFGVPVPRHQHQWEERGIQSTYRSTTTGPGELPTEQRVVLRCKTCGDIKSVRL